jgi:hypothetical protein
MEQSTMDPYLNSLAFKRLEVPPEEAPQPHQAYQPSWDKNLRHQLGGLLVTIGQRMQANGLEISTVFEDIGCVPIEDEIPALR